MDVNLYVCLDIVINTQTCHTVHRVDTNAGIEQLKQPAHRVSRQAGALCVCVQLTEALKERYNHKQRGLVDCRSAKYPN